jgi:hypothetical protein
MRLIRKFECPDLPIIHIGPQAKFELDSEFAKFADDSL